MKAGMKRVLSAVTGGALLISAPAGAVDVNIRITGEIYIPPCKIENDAEIAVHFGAIALRDVDGKQHAKSRTVSISCDYHQGTPHIRLSSGNIFPGGQGNVLQTTQGPNTSTLGIALYQGEGVNTDFPLKIGPGTQGYGYEIRNGLSAVNVQNSQFTFTAVPYKTGNGDLVAGTFGASVTMSISYV